VTTYHYDNFHNLSAVNFGTKNPTGGMRLAQSCDQRRLSQSCDVPGNPRKISTSGTVDKVTHRMGPKPYSTWISTTLLLSHHVGDTIKWWSTRDGFSRSSALQYQILAERNLHRAV